MAFQKKAKLFILVICNFVGGLSLKAPQEGCFTESRPAGLLFKLCVEAKIFASFIKCSSVTSMERTLFKEFSDRTVEFCLPLNQFRDFIKIVDKISSVTGLLECAYSSYDGIVPANVLSKKTILKILCNSLFSVLTSNEKTLGVFVDSLSKINNRLFSTEIPELVDGFPITSKGMLSEVGLKSQWYPLIICGICQIIEERGTELQRIAKECASVVDEQRASVQVSPVSPEMSRVSSTSPTLANSISTGSTSSPTPNSRRSVSSSLPHAILSTDRTSSPSPVLPSLPWGVMLTSGCWSPSMPSGWATMPRSVTSDSLAPSSPITSSPL